MTGSLPTAVSSKWPVEAEHRDLRAAVADFLNAFDDGVVPIVQTGHPVLRTPAAPYTGQLGDLLPRLLNAMTATMHAAPGVGLAAPQIGIGLAIAVIQDPGMAPDAADVADVRERFELPFQVLINPSYEAVGSDTRAFFEGCLSVAGLQGVVRRPRQVRLRSQNATGGWREQLVTGWPARIVQHETDHLNGQLYLDHVETRSISSTENYGQFWAHEAAPLEAARVLGFAEGA